MLTRRSGYPTLKFLDYIGRPELIAGSNLTAPVSFSYLPMHCIRLDLVYASAV